VPEAVAGGDVVVETEAPRAAAKVAASEPEAAVVAGVDAESASHTREPAAEVPGIGEPPLAMDLGAIETDAAPEASTPETTLLLPEPVREMEFARSLAGAQLPAHVYANLLAHLRLTGRGAAYLAHDRRLDPAAAAAYGYRSLDGRWDWAAPAEHLAGSYRPEELAAAGFPLDDDGAVTLPFNGRFPALLIPFRRAGEVVGIRFRNLLPDHPDYKHNRYRTLTAAKPLWPYAADALRRPTVHVVEGELNAETLRQLGEPAAGLYGAGAWLDHWTAELAGAHRIVAWYDCRDRKRAGDMGAAALRRRLAAAYGEAWTAQRWRRMITEVDPNALHQQGRLAAILRAKPWLSVEAAEVHAA
jgi:hypothetical protein